METSNSGNLNHWVVTVEQDGEDLILPLPEDMLAQVGWKPGDVLQWKKNKDKSWTLQKKKQSAKEDS